MEDGNLDRVPAVQDEPPQPNDQVQLSNSLNQPEGVTAPSQQQNEARIAFERERRARMIIIAEREIIIRQAMAALNRMNRSTNVFDIQLERHRIRQAMQRIDQLTTSTRHPTVPARPQRVVLGELPLPYGGRPNNDLNRLRQLEDNNPHMRDRINS